MPTETFTQRVHIIEPTRGATGPGASVTLAHQLYLDGSRVPWWGDSAYPLARWDEFPGFDDDGLRVWSHWDIEISGGRTRETRVTLALPADQISIDMTARRTTIAGIHNVLTPPPDDVDLPAMLAAARLLSPRAPVLTTLIVGRVTVGNLDDIPQAERRAIPAPRDGNTHDA